MKPFKKAYNRANRVITNIGIAVTNPMPDASSIPADDFERHRAAVTRYVRYLVRNAADAEDLVQEVFLRAHCNRESLRDAQAVESWLFQIATHASIDRMRQRDRAVQREAGQPVEDLPISDRKQPSAFTVVQQSEMSACVQKYVAKLSDAYKAVLLMHDVDGLTAAGIAELLKLPLTTVKMRLHRARRQLQAALNDACAFEGDERGVLICEPKPKVVGAASPTRRATENLRVTHAAPRHRA